MLLRWLLRQNGGIKLNLSSIHQKKFHLIGTYILINHTVCLTHQYDAVNGGAVAQMLKMMIKCEHILYSGCS